MNGIEKDLAGKATVVRLNVLSRLGREISFAHDVKAVPTTLVFDPMGTVRYRHEGLPSRKGIVRRVAGP